jgi:hypothetical protein
MTLFPWLKRWWRSRKLKSTPPAVFTTFLLDEINVPAGAGPIRPGPQEFTPFLVDQVNVLRREAQKAGQVPADGPEGWSRSDVDPIKLLAVFTSLRLTKGFVLRAYQYRSSGEKKEDRTSKSTGPVLFFSERSYQCQVFSRTR